MFSIRKSILSPSDQFQCSRKIASIDCSVIWILLHFQCFSFNFNLTNFRIQKHIGMNISCVLLATRMKKKCQEHDTKTWISWVTPKKIVQSYSQLHYHHCLCHPDVHTYVCHTFTLFSLDENIWQRHKNYCKAHNAEEMKPVSSFVYGAILYDYSLTWNWFRLFRVYVRKEIENQ